jgi:hypothetical protein
MFSATISPRKVSIRVRERTIRHLLLLYVPKTFAKCPSPGRNSRKRGNINLEGRIPQKGRFISPGTFWEEPKKSSAPISSYSSKELPAPAQDTEGKRFPRAKATFTPVQ